MGSLAINNRPEWGWVKSWSLAQYSEWTETRKLACNIRIELDGSCAYLGTFGLFGFFSWVYHIYQFIWVNYNDLTVLPHWESWLVRGIIPKWPYFSLVNYYNLPIYIYIRLYIYIVGTCSRKYWKIIVHIIHNYWIILIYPEIHQLTVARVIFGAICGSELIMELSKKTSSCSVVFFFLFRVEEMIMSNQLMVIIYYMYIIYIIDIYIYIHTLYCNIICLFFHPSSD